MDDGDLGLLEQVVLKKLGHSGGEMLLDVGREVLVGDGETGKRHGASLIVMLVGQTAGRGIAGTVGRSLGDGPVGGG